MKALTQNELNCLLNSITDARLRLMITLAAFHGMRNTEVCMLRKADVDLDTGTITIRRLKGSKTTTQPLREEEKTGLAETLAKLSKSPYVFPNRSGNPFSRGTFWLQFKKACRKAGIANRNVHSLKHFTCMTLLKNGMELVHLKEFVGHRSINSTMQYLCINQDEACKEAEIAFRKAFDIRKG